MTRSTFEGTAFGLGGTASKTMKNLRKRFDTALRLKLKNGVLAFGHESIQTHQPIP